ncbi:conserved Plasmodium protein, unknown function [Plasmodium ovale]|uniref:Uncharacterized protein n=1 Tax=Plasmodium ovale TaxID=36330 RepID=A0A1C3KQL0_PLAOA|nr:conserved Plasmodium protein, unknown function [Plasmodium ovale]
MLCLERLNALIESKYTLSNWKKKKFIWRYSLFFSIFYISLTLGILYTLIVRLLISSEKFSNHACNSSKIISIKRIYMVLLIFIILMGFLNFLISRLTHLYSRFTNSGFFNLGIYYRVVGFLIKYISWILSLIYISWISFLIINIITIFYDSEKWCSIKYNTYGMDAFNNCLLLKNGDTGCQIAKDVINLRSKESCSDFNVLKMQSFLFLVRASPNLTCTLKDKKLCDFFVDFLKSKQSSWDSFPNCLGNTTDLTEEYFLESSHLKSDIYLFSVSIIFFWFITTVILFALFIIVKVNTPIDSSFIINEERLNFFFKFTRSLDVWR